MCASVYLSYFLYKLLIFMLLYNLPRQWKDHNRFNCISSNVCIFFRLETLKYRDTFNFCNEHSGLEKLSGFKESRIAILLFAHHKKTWLRTFFFLIIIVIIKMKSRHFIWWFQDAISHCDICIIFLVKLLL